MIKHIRVRNCNDGEGCTLEKLMPISANDRIVLLDVLRGAALLGILLININMLHTPMMYKQLLGIELWTSAFDQLLFQIVNFFVQGKFYTLFSFLFGCGFYIFMSRAEQKMISGNKLFFRRAVILLGFGLIHIIFFWWGDILTWYALAGMLLLFFYKQPSKSLIGWAIGISAVYLLLNLLLIASAMNNPSALGGPGVNAVYYSMISSSYQLYSGSYTDAMAQRLIDLSFYLPNVTLAAVFTVLPMFLFGLFAAKKGWLANVRAHIGSIRIIWLASFAAGFGFTALKAWSASRVEPGSIGMYDVYQVIGTVIGDPALCFFYIASGALLVVYAPKLAIWRWLISAGRMALTNYLLQSVICTTLFYGYGFGLYGKLGAAEAYGIAVVIFSFQLLLSRWWMNKFTYGPIERLWRIWTYGRKG